jgi:hypothetical protein
MKPVGKNQYKFYGDSLTIDGLDGADLSTLTIQNHIMMVDVPWHSNGEFMGYCSFPLGWMSMDGRNIYTIDAIAGVESGDIIPIWSLDGFDNVVEE